MSAPIRDLGAGTVRWIATLGGVTRYGASVLRALVTPPVRWRLALDEVHKLGVLSIVIIGVSGLAVGMVLGLQGYRTLNVYGADSQLGAFVSLALIRELGPVLTALLVTGRAGSATTAEIASMVATEQMDGLRMMSIDPVHYVLTPRAVSMTLVMPLLSALFIVTGLLGGYLVAVGVTGGDPSQFLSSVQDNVVFREDVLGSVLKSFVFGLLVALIATYRGFTAEPTSAGVSAATTSTVVVSSVVVLLFDYVITALWGM